jgi:GT2 family glycosyltransferase
LKLVKGEIIVVDNASKDDSCDRVKQLFPEVKLIENQENLGFSKANNQGVAIAQGKYVLILNPDTVLAENILLNLYNFSEKQKNVGFTAIPLYDGVGHFLPESKRNFPTPSVALQKLMGYTKNYYNQTNSQTPFQVPIFTGAFMFTEKEKYHKIEGFDEQYFMYGEDIDISYEMIKAGYSNYYFPTLKAIHFKGESTHKNPEYLNRFYNAMRLFYQKQFNVNKGWYLLMSTGISVFKLLHSFKLKISRPQHSFSFKNGLYVGSENEVFNALNELFSHAQWHLYAVCETRTISRYQDLDRLQDLIQDKQIKHIVWDIANQSFEKIIFYITSLHEIFPEITYSFRPEGQHFILGSHDSTSKGYIYKWNDMD